MRKKIKRFALGEFLKTLREKKGVSLRDVENVIGIPVEMYEELSNEYEELSSEVEMYEKLSNEVEMYEELSNEMEMYEELSNEKVLDL